jgi:hypothetical protein
MWRRQSSAELKRPGLPPVEDFELSLNRQMADTYRVLLEEDSRGGAEHQRREAALQAINVIGIGSQQGTLSFLKP